MVDYAGAIWIPNNNFFPDRKGLKPQWIILHGTAGGSSAQGIASYFQGTEGTANPVSSHYIVGQDGTVVQTVAEKDGSWANGVVTPGHDPWWSDSGNPNPNNITTSIEHVKPDSANATALTSAQQAASFALIRDICTRNNIPIRAANASGGITGHYSIDPVNRSRCPGPYPWDALWQYLGENMPPTPNQLKEAQDCWNSFFNVIGQKPPATGTNIYQAWLSEWVNYGKQYGPPITYEYNSNDWNGNQIVAQEFAHARCEFRAGIANWYSINGKL